MSPRDNASKQSKSLHAHTSSEDWTPLGFADRTSQPAQMRKAAGMTGDAVMNHLETANKGGLPAQLKAGVENLSGVAMDDVKVHRNSSKPAALGAHAYAQGTDIHLGPGQEQHLPHEAWHVAQQKQGRVPATAQFKGGPALNDDPTLEAEADTMGARAMRSGAHEDAAQRASTPAASGQISGSAPVQGKFADDTTFGLEIEFKNRWVSAYDYGKGLKEIPAVGSPLKGWKSGTDRGRPSKDSTVCGTVLEYESDVYTGAQVKKGDLELAIEAAMALSKKNALAVRDANTLDESGEEYKRLKETSHEDHDSVKANSEQHAKDHKKDPMATLQITTLGKRTDAHIKTLSDVTAAIDKLSAEQAVDLLPKAIVKTLMAAKSEARINIALLKSNSKCDPKPLENQLLMEDLSAIVSALTQSIVLAENGVGGGGSIKNLIDPMPRRIIAPPKKGFMTHLDIKKDVYCGLIDNFTERIKDIEDFSGHYDALALMAWFAHGAKSGSDIVAAISYVEEESGSPAVYPYTFKELWEFAETKIKKTGRPSLLHDIAGSHPTLEEEIIKTSGKLNPKEWTAHEIRNSFFACAMSQDQMQEFIDLVAKHIDD